MSLPPSRLLTGAVSAIALGALAVPATSFAAPSGNTTIDLRGAAASSLKQQRVTLSATSPAKATAKRLSLRVSGGSVSAKSATISHDGKLTLKAGKRSAILSNVRVTLGSRSSIAASVGGKKVTLFTVTPAKKQPIKLSASAKTAAVQRAAVKLTPAGLRTLRSALGTKRLAGGAFGTLTVKADVTPTAPPAVTPPVSAPPNLPPPVVAPAPPVVTPPVPPAPNVPSPVLTCAAAPAGNVAGATWTVKSTFLSYLQGGIAHGAVGCGDGAFGTRTDGKVDGFAFGAATGVSYASGTGAVTATFPGSVRFIGHNYGKGPLLDITIENLHVVSTDGATGTLRADFRRLPFGGQDPSAPPPAPTVLEDVDFATVNDLNTKRSGTATVTWTGVSPMLTVAGSDAFGDFYAPGDALDPITFSVVLPG